MGVDSNGRSGKVKYEELKQKLKEEKKEEALRYLERLEKLPLKRGLLEEIAQDFLRGEERKAKLRASAFLGLKEELDPQVFDQCVQLYRALLSRIRGTLQAARASFAVGAHLKKCIFLSYPPQEEEVVRRNLEALELLGQFESFLSLPEGFFEVLLFDSLLLSFCQKPSAEAERCLRELFAKELVEQNVQSLLLELQREKERRRKLELKLMEVLRSS